MIPSIGRIVILHLTPSQRVALGGNHTEATPSEAPAIICKVWSNECVNLRVLGDCPHTLWVTSVLQGEEEGQWHEPKRV